MSSPNARSGKNGSETGVQVPFGAKRTPLDVLVLQRTAGNAAVTTIVARQVGVQKEKESAPSSPETGGYDAISVWFPHNSTTLRQDAEMHGTALLQTAAAAVRAVIAQKKDAIVVIAGYASEEGAPAHNRDLSRRRAEAVKALLVRAGIPAANLTTEGRGVTRSQSPRAWNRRVEIMVSAPQPLESAAPPAKKPFQPRGYSTPEAVMMERLEALAVMSRKEGEEGEAFADVVTDFKAALRQRIMDTGEDNPLPPDLKVVVFALLYWASDPGYKWGEGSFDSKDLTLSCAEYATVPASQNKCSSYVAEVLFKAVGAVHKVYESKEQANKWFPHRAADWGDAQRAIPGYPVVDNAQMGDVWSNGSHVGIFLGSYDGKLLYVSARDDGSGVFALDKVQHAHGVQVKLMPSGGVYRRYTP